MGSFGFAKCDHYTDVENGRALEPLRCHEKAELRLVHFLSSVLGDSVRVSILSRFRHEHASQMREYRLKRSIYTGTKDSPQLGHAFALTSSRLDLGLGDWVIWITLDGTGIRKHICR